MSDFVNNRVRVCTVCHSAVSFSRLFNILFSAPDKKG